MTGIQITVMTADEARATVTLIKTTLENVRALLWDLHEREGWRALGYPTWRDCITAEFHMSQQHAHRLLNAHTVDRILAPPSSDSPRGESESPVAHIPEKYARELEPLVGDESAVREVYGEVMEATGGKPTQTDFRAAVDRYLGKTDDAEPSDVSHGEPVAGDVIDEVVDALEDSGAYERSDLQRRMRYVWTLRLSWVRFVTEHPPDVLTEGLRVGDLGEVIEDCDRLLEWLRRARETAMTAGRPRKVAP